jgi:hypothetical protein
MYRDRGAMGARGFYQLPILQLRNRTLHCALGKAGFIGQHAQTGFDRLPVLAGGAAGKMKVNEEGRRLLIMPDDIAHEYVENVIIDRDGSVEARHAPKEKVKGATLLKRQIATIPIKGQHFSRRIAA